ncbi:UNVERIFIED_CONTAM: hypothetical protein Sangu_0321200 [Sesamum angustifolium]|uniref:Uncharacterized protein n=1 Tax=Sesamum angustifolium TaxID=2727405 RepID=A0AAW2QR65_9LAMI
MKDSTSSCNPSSPSPASISTFTSTPPSAVGQEGLSETMIEESISRAEPIRKWKRNMGGLKFSSILLTIEEKPRVCSKLRQVCNRPSTTI